MRSRFLIGGGLAAIAVLALGWSAFGADDRNGRGNGDRPERWEIPVPPPPGGPLGPEGGELTYGELHVQRDGEAVTVRVDAGEVTAVDSDSVTIEENDGNEVEIPVDDETEVRAGPMGELSLEDLEEGDRVHVNRDEGEAADAICVLPEGRPPMPPFPGEAG